MKNKNTKNTQNTQDGYFWVKNDSSSVIVTEAIAPPAEPRRGSPPEVGPPEVANAWVEIKALIIEGLELEASSFWTLAKILQVVKDKIKAQDILIAQLVAEREKWLLPGDENEE